MSQISFERQWEYGKDIRCLWYYLTFKKHKTNEYERQHINVLAGRQELLLSTVKRRTLSWFGHVCRHDTVPKIMLHGTADGSRRRRRPRKSWRDSIKEWTGQSLSSLLRIVDERIRLATITAVASVRVPSTTPVHHGSSVVSSDDEDLISARQVEEKKKKTPFKDTMMLTLRRKE